MVRTTLVYSDQHRSSEFYQVCNHTLSFAMRLVSSIHPPTHIATSKPFKPHALPISISISYLSAKASQATSHLVAQHVRRMWWVCSLRHRTSLPYQQRTGPLLKSQLRSADKAMSRLQDHPTVPQIMSNPCLSYGSCWSYRCLCRGSSLSLASPLTVSTAFFPWNSWFCFGRCLRFFLTSFHSCRVEFCFFKRSRSHATFVCLILDGLSYHRVRVSLSFPFVCVCFFLLVLYHAFQPSPSCLWNSFSCAACVTYFIPPFLLFYPVLSLLPSFCVCVFIFFGMSFRLGSLFKFFLTSKASHVVWWWWWW